MLFIHNAGDVAVDVIAVNGADESVPIEDLEPGKRIPYDRLGDCLDTTLVARDQARVEVARGKGPFCRGTTWTID